MKVKKIKKMRKKICAVTCIYLLTGLVSGCGSEKSNLIENDNAAAVEESSVPEMVDVAALGNDQTLMTGESAGEIVSPEEKPDWKQAYLAKAEEIETEEGPLKYDLIYFDADDIPELVAGPKGHGFHLYTWKDGEVYELVNCIDYGTYKAVHLYNPYQGVIARDFPNIETIISEIYVTNYTEYYKLTEDMNFIEQYRLMEQCQEEGSAYFYREASTVVEITEKEFSSYTEGDWLEIAGRYDQETFCSLLEKTGDLWKEEELLVLEGLDRKTLKIIQYTDADGNEFYITEEKALQEAAALLGELRGIPSTWKPDYRHKDQHNYCTISFCTTDGRWDYVVYEGNNLQHNIGDSGFQMQDDFEEVLADLLYFTSTDYLLTQVESEEERQTIQVILEEEGSQLVHLVANRLDDLNYCLFETSAGKGLEFHLLLWGSWEGKEVQQHQIFSLNEEDHLFLDQLSAWCEVTKEDMDFDGRPDLLIYEGSNGGTGGSFQYNRVMRWDEAQGQFAYYPSFPFMISFLNLEDKQVIFKAKGGAVDREVQIYSVVDGEYRAIQELYISEEYVTEEYEGETKTYWKTILSYYENGELVQEYNVTGMNRDEREELCREEGLSEIFSYTEDYG